MRQLSSSRTPLYKYVFVGFWIVGFGFGTINMFVAEEPNYNNDFEYIEYFFLAVSVSSSVGLYFWLGRLTTVWLTSTSIVAIRFGSKHEVPLTNIWYVKGSRFSNPETVTVYFKKSTDLGKSIRFLPPFRFFRLFQEHPLANELGDISARAKAKMPSSRSEQ